MRPRSDKTALGLAWVENGKLKVKNPGPGGAPAKIIPSDGVEVFVEGVKITGETEVTESSNVIIRPVEQPPHVSFKFQITPDDLEAYVMLEVIDGVRYKVKDTEPSHRLELDVESEPIPACVDPQEIIQGAEKAGIRFGLDTQACHKVSVEKPSKPVLIASGVPATPGQDGIAVKTPPKPGLPGKGVSGKAIPPKKPRDPRLRAGKGVELKQEGDFVLAVATTSGWPRYNEASGIVEVDEVYYHRGDVDLSSGNLKTSGSIEVAGNVFEGMRVESEGNQTISGTVTDAELIAWGNITVRGNVFKSRISAGKDVKWLHRWNDLLANVEESLVRIMEIKALDRRLAEEAQNAAGNAAVADIKISDSEVLFDYFRQLIVSLSALYKEDLSQLPNDIIQRILGTREKIAGPRGDVYQRAQSIEGDINYVRAWIEYEFSKGESDVIVPYVQSSTIEASRDIVVTGQGALYSNLSAGRAVKVVGSPGIVRGGEVSAAELIHVNQAGSQGSAATVLRVSEKGKIIAGTIYPNTTLILGRLKARTENLLESVEIRIVDERLVISSRSGVVEMDG